MNKHSKKFITLLVLLSISFTGAWSQASSSQDITSENNNSIQELIDSIDLDRLNESNDHESMVRLSVYYYQVGLYEDALKYVDKALIIKDTMEYRILKYDVLNSLKKSYERRKFVETTLQTYSEDYASLSIEDRMIYCYFLTLAYNNEEAIEKYESILDEASEIELKDIIYNNIALASLKIGDFNKAKDYSLKSLEINPNDSISLTNLGNSYYGLSEYEAAKEAYKKAIIINPNNSYAVYGMAKTLEELEDEAYIDYWKEYHVLEPNDIKALETLYEYYLEASDKENALIMLEKIVGSKYGTDHYVKELIGMYSDLGYYEKLKSLLYSYKEINGEYYLDLLLADYSFEKISKEEGMALYVEFLDKYETDSWDLHFMAKNIYSMDKKIGGILYFSKFIDAINEKLDFPKGTEIEAKVYREFEDYDGLLLSAKKLVKAKPSDYSGYSLLADAYSQLGDYNKAYENYKKAGTLTENNVYVDLWLIDSAIYINKIDEAEKLIDKMIIKYGDDRATLYVQRARIYSLRGEDEKAIESLVKAFDMSEFMYQALDTYKEFSKYKGDKRLENSNSN